jgi:hypothetical protein
MKPAWPLIDAAKLGTTVETLRAGLGGPVQRALTDLRAMLTNGLTIRENMLADIVTLELTHGVEKEKPNPGAFKPIGFIPIYAEDSDGQAVALPACTFNRNPESGRDWYGVTARYPAPLGLCSVSRDSNQNIASGAAFTAVQFSDEDLQVGDAAWSSGANTRITLASAGVVRVTRQGLFDTAAGGYRVWAVRKNGAGNYAETITPGGSYAGSAGSDLIEVAAGDYLEFCVQQTSGAALNLLVSDRIAMTAEYVSPPLDRAASVTGILVGG